MTRLVKSGNTTRTGYHCNFGSTCDPVAYQPNSSYLHVQACCHEDLCNNGTSPPLEQGKKYCYSATCREDNCLPGLLSRIDEEKLGTFCVANGSDCQTQKEKFLQSDGTWETIDYTGCTQLCSSIILDLKDYKANFTCCNVSLCNGVNQTDETFIDPLKKYCYKYRCYSDSPGFCHLGVLDDAVKHGRAGVCPMTEEGCFYYDWYNRHSNAEHGFVTGCHTEGYHVEISCTAKVTKDVNITRVWQQCCDSDRCNSIIAQGSIPKTSQCYSLSCTGDGCLNAAIKEKNHFLCNKSEFGCENIYLKYVSACTCHLKPSDQNPFCNSFYGCSMSITNMRGGASLSSIQYLQIHFQVGLLKTANKSIYTIGCSNTKCTRGSVKPDGRTLIGCCDEDPCIAVMTVSSGSTFEAISSEPTFETVSSGSTVETLNSGSTLKTSWILMLSTYLCLITTFRAIQL